MLSSPFESFKGLKITGCMCVVLEFFFQLSRAEPGPADPRLRSFQFKSQSLHSAATINEPFLTRPNTHTCARPDARTDTFLSRLRA